jgi:nucleoside-diphosphate-sugar epimerase
MDKIENKRILITGGNGYLGSHLAEALKKSGAKVYILDLSGKNDEYEFTVDICDKMNLEQIVEKVKPHIIYHLAAVLNRERSFEHHHQIMNVNYFGTINLLQALQRIEYEQFIFTSSSEIYGNNTAPFHEDQLPDPCSPYSLSKIFAEQAIKAFSNINGKNFTILRLFNFMGSNMPGEFFTSQLICSLQNNIPFNMTGGEQIRDYLYVDDVVSALILAAENEKSINEVFNVCSGVGTSLKDLVVKFKNKFNKDCPVNFGKLPYRKNEIWNMAGDNLKIRNNLGYQPRYSLDEAIDLIK